MKKTDFNENWIFYKEGSRERRKIRLPHDAMLEEERSADAPGGAACAYFHGGKYCYEKVLTAEEARRLAGKHAEIYFEGVYRYAKVYVNGELLAEHDYGYTPFSVTLDGKLRNDEDNLILVTADNSDMPNSRWYSGSGIYRPVSLYVSDPAHVKLHGIRVTTVSVTPPTVCVETAHTGDEVLVRIEDPETGTVLAEGSGEKTELVLRGAELWDTDHPRLYRCRGTVLSSDAVTDEEEEYFGIREISWTNRGFFVNGNETLLRGACVHHDNGLLGARSFPEAEERRVRILKEAGYNAVRSSHNPAAESFLSACDRLGMYVMDETWDMWYKAKSTEDYSKVFEKNFEDDIRTMIARDFNHPSVIMYSIGNEVSEPATARGMEFAHRMIDLFHELDPKRPVSGGMNLMIISRSAAGNDIYKEGGGRSEENSDKKAGEMNSLMFNMITMMLGSTMNKAANGKKADLVTTPILDALDVAGYNYASGRYPMEGKKHPDRLIYGSETFPGDIFKNWKMVKKYPYVVGDFMWTGWDYLGEVGAGAWTYSAEGKGFEKPYPWILADAGAIDALGNPTGELCLAQAAWGMLDAPRIMVRPVNRGKARLIRSAWRSSNGLHSWAWRDCEGQTACVEVYGCGKKAELVLNGKSLGKKTLRSGKAIFKVKYQPGWLKARMFDEDGREMGRDVLISAGNETGVRLQAENRTPVSGEVVFIKAAITDRQGVIERNADRQLRVRVENGELLACGSANPRTEERFLDETFTTYYGMGQIIVRKTSKEPVKVTVCEDGGREVSVTL